MAKVLVGQIYRDVSPYGRGGKRGRRVRVLKVIALTATHALCTAEWRCGRLAGRSPREIHVKLDSLGDHSRFQKVKDAPHA